jgi:hypothetical protein
MSQNGNNSKNKGLSDKAQENLRKNAEIRSSRKMKAKRFLFLNDGQEIIEIFDPE